MVSLVRCFCSVPSSNLMDSKSISLDFIEWFVGFVDGEGTFSFSKNRNSYAFTFKVPQSVYNRRCLEYIQQTLKVGSITNDGPNDLQWRVRDKFILLHYIIPLIDQYPLRTVKHHSYSIFKEALMTNDVNRLDHLKEQLSLIPPHYKSPFTDKPTKNWIIGFIEAEGSFYIESDRGRLLHGFNIKQKKDKHVLELIRSELGICANVVLSGGCWKVQTKNVSNLFSVISYLQGQLVGMKSVELNIWAHSFIYFRGNNPKLREVRESIRNMRNAHKTSPKKR